MISNRRLVEDALYKHFKSDYAKHFVNTEVFNRLTSLVLCVELLTLVICRMSCPVTNETINDYLDDLIFC